MKLSKATCSVTYPVVVTYVWPPINTVPFTVFLLQDARKFGAQIRKALQDLMQLLSPSQKIPSKTEERLPEVKKDL